MWLLPLLALGLAVAFVGSRERAPARPPGPLAVLGECLRIGRSPPPQVILCALAEAEQLGRPDVAQGIVRTFIEPVVREHERRAALAAGPARSEAPQLETAEQPLALAERARSDRDIDEALERAAQMERELEPELEPELRRAPPIIEAQAYELPMPIEEPPPPVRARRVSIGGTLPVPVPVPTSPVPHIPTTTWAMFRARLVREEPAYQSERHIGQYRQRRESLAEIGLDARRLIGDELAQQAALDAELADAYAHVVDGGMMAYVGSPIAVPGSEAPVAVTLSGVLGVIQAAGLEAAENWLAAPKNRRRFPHTMAAFVRSNGAF
jgi:hypothetical protein